MELTEEQIKSLEQVQYLTFEDTNCEKSTDSLKSERRIIHYISTPQLDRGADVMMPKGMNSDNYNNTKSVFFNHNYDYPIGKNVKLATTNDGVKATTYFSTDAKANDIYNLHLEGVINSWSIGFKPMMNSKTGMVEKDSVEWKADTNIRIFHQWELLEYSSTGIPMNPNAVDISKSICKSFEMKSHIDTMSLELSVKEQLDNYRKEINSLKELTEQLKAGSNLDELKAEIESLKTQLTKNIDHENNQISKEALKALVTKTVIDKWNAFSGQNIKL